MPKQKTIFTKPKSKKYSNIIKIDSIENAEKSIKMLKKEYNSAKTNPKRLHIIRSLNQAANISLIMANNKRNSSSVRSEKKKISKLYKEAQEDASKDYKKRK